MSQTPDTSSPTVRPPAPARGPSALGCAFTLSLLLNLLCGGVFLLSCLGGFFVGSLGGDVSSTPLTEKFLSGKSDAKDKVAVVSLDGVIMEGLLGYVHKQIEQAAKDKSVKAILFKINSPGGSITGSDDLHRRLVELRDGNPEKKYPARPMVVLMESLAASGGYYVAMPASHIVAERTTLTGSIGVYAAFPNVAKMGKEYGFGMDTIKQGEVKASGSPFKEMSDKERAVWQDMVNQSYNQFVDVVETGRPALKHKDGADRGDWPLLKRFDWKIAEAGNPDQDGGNPKLTPAQATRYLADGGVYTAREAIKHQLIDEVGTIDDAVNKAKELANLGDVKVIQYEKPKTLSETLFGVQSAKPGSQLDAGLTQNALRPRLWYLAPGSELAGWLAAAGRE